MLKSPYLIIKVVSNVYSVPMDLVLSNNRKALYATPRHVSMYLCQNILGLSSSSIGHLFNKDHSTVISAIRKVSKNSELISAVKMIRNELIKPESQKKLLSGALNGNS